MVLLCAFCYPSHACFILVLSDGQKVLVGNHEDWFDQDAQVIVYPADAGRRYASVVFTFASEGWAQGGMNEHGLFFDGAFTPFTPLDIDAGLDTFEGYVWQEMLDKCKNVEEAVAFLSRYNLSDLEQSHVVLADASGARAVLGVYEGKLVRSIGTRSWILQTNFNRWNPQKDSCARYQLAARALKQDHTVSQDRVAEILAQTHQGPLTVYSNIYDLTAKTVSIYRGNEYDTPFHIDLSIAKQSGYQVSDVHALFDGSVVDKEEDLQWSGTIVNRETGRHVAYANMGFPDIGWGTVSDSMGRVHISLSSAYRREVLYVSAPGMATRRVPMYELRDSVLLLDPLVITLPEIQVEGAGKPFRGSFRQGWMKGRHGVLPVDESEGGGALAVLMALPSGRREVLLDEVWVRILYSSEQSYSFRLRCMQVDSMGLPGADLVHRNVLLKGSRRIGWEKFSLEGEHIRIESDSFFLVLEWMQERAERERTRNSLASWDRWKKAQFIAGNPKVEQYGTPLESGLQLRYNGDMRDWPGFEDMDALTAIIVDDVPRLQTRNLRTYTRDHSYAKWKKQRGAANVILKMKAR